MSRSSIKQRLANAAADRAARATGQEYNQRVADFVTSQDQQAVEDIARLVEEITLARQARNDSVHSRVRQVTGLYGRNGLPDNSVPDDEEYQYGETP